jgi:glutathionylspermidine synthase
MRRVACEERPDWRAEAERTGFVFHTASGERYWDERAYYAFTLSEIEHDIEAPTAELDAMGRELVERAIADDRLLRILKIPERYWNFIASSWKRGDKSLYGRLDLRYDGNGPAKLLEYNADTPTSAFETGVFQWMWLEGSIARGTLPKDADQYNSLHEKLIEGWKQFGTQTPLHFACDMSAEEDCGTVSYLQDCATQAGLRTITLAVEEIGRDDKGQFVDKDDQPIELMFKLYPWEWMLREKFGESLPGAATRWIKPPWKMILSNKGILPLLWALHPGHPNLLPACFEDDPRAGELGNSYVRKPLYSREGANIQFVVDGKVADFDDGPYGKEGFIRQAAAPLPVFDRNHTVIGSWIAAGVPCGLSVREDATLITKNTSRFVPHAIIG